MKKFFATTAAAAMMASSAIAGSIDGDGDTIEITRNGVDYICNAQIEVIDGVPSRRCVRAGAVSGAGAGLFAAGLGGGAAAGLGLLGLIVLASAIDDDDDTTNGTN